MPQKRFWFFAIPLVERVTCAATFGGRVLDAMDSQVYALVLPTLITVFALTRAQAGALGSLTTLVAAVSTLFAGAAIDRFGRLRMLQGAILLSAAATVAAAFAHSFVYLAAMRAIQGIGYAAELTAAMTLVNEAITPKFRGTAISWVQSGYAVGYALALLGTLAIYTMLPAREAWRYCFALGIIPALYVLVLQRFVKESPLFLAQRAEIPAAQDKSSMLDLLHGSNGRNTAITAMISIGVYGAAQIMIFWLPTYLHSAFHLNVTKTAGYMVLNILGSFLGALVYGPITDRYGRRPVFLAYLLCQLVALTAYLGFTRILGVTLGLGFVVGLLQGGLANGVQPIIAELFGTRIRGRALGLNTSLIRASTALSPALVGVLAMHLSFGKAIGVVAMALYAVAVLGVLLVPETRGVELTAETAPAGPQPDAPGGARTKIQKSIVEF